MPQSLFLKSEVGTSTRIFTSDDATLGVIFNNLTGKNFIDPPAWRVMTHKDYLTSMEREVGATLLGQEIQLVDEDSGRILQSAVINIVEPK